MARDALIAIGIALITVGLYELLGFLERLSSTAPQTKAPNPLGGVLGSKLSVGPSSAQSRPSACP
jgi:hypothetical protein